TIDGPPKLQTVHGSTVMRVVNTPFIIVLDPATKTYYLRTGDRWVSARSLDGPWQVELSPPVQIASALPASVVSPERDGLSGNAKIVVATEPTELIVCDGEPQWVPIVDDEL